MNDELVKKLQQKAEEVLTVEYENSSLLQRVEADQTDIDILKVRIAELEEEKARRDEQNEYFKLKNKELEAVNAKKENKMYMLNKVLESLIGKSVEQRFEEIQLEEVHARRKAEIKAEMKNKGKGVTTKGVSEVTEGAIVLSISSESPIQNPRHIIAVSGTFEEDVEIDDIVNEEEDDEEVDDDDDDDKKDDADDVFSTSSHDDDDRNDDDDDIGTSGIKVTEASTKENVDDYLHDDANEEPENAGSEGGGDVDDQNVDESEKLILRLEPDVEEGEIRHTYTMDDIIKMMHIDDINFKFDFKDELNDFDINQQPDYQYKYVEEADNYDRVEVEDCSDEESSENVDTSNFPTLVEFFSQANIDDLRRKVEECLKNKNFDGTAKDESREERKKWFRKDTQRKFKRPLKFYKRDREVNAYAIRREYGVQYFEYIQDIMSLPWWDVEELPKYEAFKDFKHWKPHYPKKVKRIDPVTGIEETILKIKKPRVIKIIPVPKMEQDFHKGFVYWVYSSKDIECLFVNKIGFQAEDKEQAMQFQKVKEEALKAEKERKDREEKDKMLRHTVVQRMAVEEKRVVEENEKLRKLLLRKPKPREEKFKSL
ncbi:hypothetical protein Hanom_Chr11g01000301 [Helianthus anomalus]